MRNIMNKLFSVLLIIGLFFISCSKQASSGYEADVTRPLIKVFYPLDTPVLQQGVPLCIKLLVSDDKNLSKVWMEVTDWSGYRKEFPVIGKSIIIIEKYSVREDATGELSANFFAIDESGNTTSYEIKFVMDN